MGVRYSSDYVIQPPGVYLFNMIGIEINYAPGESE